MKFIADFHIHSHYSVATSKKLTPEFLDYWARIKGITVVGTGDFTHPGWIEELKEKLEPAEQGLFKLKQKYKIDEDMPVSLPGEVRFMLQAEISSIYKKNGKVRKVHNIILAPDFKTVEKIQKSLQDLGGNITSDGRPILGLDSRSLLELSLEANDDIFFIPAHIWTPWFSVLGSRSGFDSVEECFDDLSGHIHAVETGLSTDPPMHWMCSFLDGYTLLSNSDAHSPEKLGRNANMLDTDLSYDAITKAITDGNGKTFLGTIDMFPQEGKYHYDGHRACNIQLNPLDTLKQRTLCPVCGKPVTIGVMNRVAHLADRDDLLKRKKRLPFSSIIPLKEILSEILCVGPNSKKVANAYTDLIATLGTELDILLNADVDDVSAAGHPLLAEALDRMRSREVYINEGYDGAFGVITVFNEAQQRQIKAGTLPDAATVSADRAEKRALLNFDLHEYKELRDSLEPEKSEAQASLF